MRRALFAASSAVAMLSGITAMGQAEGEKPGGWRTIFDGKSLEGWEHVGPGSMVLQDGFIRTEGGMGLLWWTREKFGDCVIRVVYRTGSPRANSGIYIRIADKPKDPWYAVHHGYEVQISDNDDEYPPHRRDLLALEIYGEGVEASRRVEHDGDHPARRGGHHLAERRPRSIASIRPRRPSPSGPRIMSRSGARGRLRGTSGSRTTATSPGTPRSISRR